MQSLKTEVTSLNTHKRPTKARMRGRCMRQSTKILPLLVKFFDMLVSFSFTMTLKFCEGN